jgi:hypothetical protein
LIGGRTRARTWDPLIKSQRRVGHPGHALDFVFLAAGSSDVLVMIEKKFTERRAQPVVLEFHSGANTEIGARIVATNPLLLRWGTTPSLFGRRPVASTSRTLPGHSARCFPSDGLPSGALWWQFSGFRPSRLVGENLERICAPARLFHLSF